jgi:putative transposase
LVNVDPLLSIIKGDWGDFLAEAISPAELDDIRKHEQTGRPLGDVSFVSQMEHLLGRELRPRKPGRKPKKSDN